MANLYLDGTNYLIDYDKDAENFINATGLYNPSNLSVGGLYTSEIAMYAINFLVNGLKGIDVWNKIKVLYPFVGGTETMHKFNLKDPRDLDAAFRIIWNGTITHDGFGIKGDGTSGWGDTKFIPFDNFTDNSTGNMSVYINDNDVTKLTESCIGINDTENQTSTNNCEMALIVRRTNGQFLGVMYNEGGALVSATADSAYGFSCANRVSLNDAQLWKNSTLITRKTTGGGGLLPKKSASILGVKLNNSIYTPSLTKCRHCFISISEGLTDAQVKGMSQIITAYQGILNRQ